MGMRKAFLDEISINMADLTDQELVSELQRFGEEVQTPIKAKKRPLLIKKLNHLKARVKAQESPVKPKTRHASTVATSSHGINTDTDSFIIQNKQSPSNSRFSSSTRTSRSFNVNNLDTLSSDDSDHEIFPSDSLPQMHSTNANFPSSKYKARPSNVSDNVLRTLRRRTGELPPTRSRRSETHEVSDELINNEIFNTQTPEKSPVPSPARSRLYPNLKRFVPTRISSQDDKFESSDSDLDGSIYSVTNKSVNTSFKSYKADDEDNDLDLKFSNGSSSDRKNISLNESQRKLLPLRRYGLSRVQPYRSRYLENLPHFLVAVVILFFMVLSVTYVVIHKDYFFSWFSTPGYMSHGDKLQCSQNGKDLSPKEMENALGTVKLWFNHVSQRKGQAICEDKPGEEFVSVAELKNLMLMPKHLNISKIYSCSLELIHSNTQWNLRTLKEDGSTAEDVSEIAMLESSVADMTLLCRLRRSLFQVLYGIFIIVVVLGVVLLLYMLIKYKLQQHEKEQKDVYAMVEKIIDLLQEHHEQAKRDDAGEPSYLAVQHVRDQLLLPATRQQMKPIWNKAVEFIAANESRIRLETKLIRGEEFDVWHWLPATNANGKIWQGQAFGENSENNSNQVIYSPTPCLKIRNMFDSNVESGENWERNVIDAILEKCENIKHIVHVYIDVDSREGCVYLKCSSCEAAGQARQALHGWWFDGRLVTVKFLRVEHYHKRWPESRASTSPLKPSTNQKRSLSQPYHRSSLEMT